MFYPTIPTVKTRPPAIFLNGRFGRSRGTSRCQEPTSGSLWPIRTRDEHCLSSDELTVGRANLCAVEVTENAPAGRSAQEEEEDELPESSLSLF